MSVFLISASRLKTVNTLFWHEKTCKWCLLLGLACFRCLTRNSCHRYFCHSHMIMSNFEISVFRCMTCTSHEIYLVTVMWQCDIVSCSSTSKVGKSMWLSLWRHIEVLHIYNVYSATNIVWWEVPNFVVMSHVLGYVMGSWRVPYLNIYSVTSVLLSHDSGRLCHVVLESQNVLNWTGRCNFFSVFNRTSGYFLNPSLRTLGVTRLASYQRT